MTSFLPVHLESAYSLIFDVYKIQENILALLQYLSGQSADLFISTPIIYFYNFTHSKSEWGCPMDIKGGIQVWGY